jgi:hypothetical protein
VELRLPSPQPRVGWTCPRCLRVWAPYVQGCQSCNLKVDAGDKSGPPPAYAGTGEASRPMGGGPGIGS